MLRCPARSIYLVVILAIIFSGLPLSGYCRGTGAAMTITGDDGKERCSFSVEIASTAEQIVKGLMHRQSLKAKHGMLFVFARDEMQSFWMKNTYIALDMVFINNSERIVHIHRNAKPLDTRGISSRRPARYVLEINGGEADECRLTVGDRVKLPASQ